DFDPQSNCVLCWKCKPLPWTTVGRIWSGTLATRCPGGSTGQARRLGEVAGDHPRARTAKLHIRRGRTWARPLTLAAAARKGGNTAGLLTSASSPGEAPRASPLPAPIAPSDQLPTFQEPIAHPNLAFFL